MREEFEERPLTVDDAKTWSSIDSFTNAELKDRYKAVMQSWNGITWYSQFLDELTEELHKRGKHTWANNILVRRARARMGI